MSILYIFGVFVSVFALSYFSAKGVLHFVEKYSKNKEMTLDLPMGFVFIIILGLGAVSFSFALPATVMVFYHMMLVMGLLCLALMGTQMKTLYRSLGMIGICFAFSYFLPQAAEFKQGFAGFFEHIWLGFFGAFMVWLFAKMDRVPFMSMLLSMGFAACMFILSSFFTVLPVALGYFAVVILVAQMGANMYLRNVLTPKLGYSASVLVGFLWASYALYFLALGHVPAVVILYAYPALEVIFAALISFGLYHNFDSYSYLVEQALAKNIMPQKVLRSIMMWMLLLAAMAALSIMSFATAGYVFYLALVIILVNVYMRLTSWGEAKVRLRDVGSDFKKGLSQVRQEFKNISFKKKNTQEETTLEQQVETPKVKPVVLQKAKVQKKTSPVPKTKTQKKMVPHKK